MDEASVKYLLCKSLDQLLCYLGEEAHSIITPGHSAPMPHTRAPLTSCTASPMVWMASISLTLQPSQNSAVSTRWERARMLSSAGPCTPTYEVSQPTLLDTPQCTRGTTM